MNRTRLTAAVLTLAVVSLLASPALAQQNDDTEDAPPVKYYVIEGLDILGDQTTGSGLVSISRTQALFERRLVLERSFLPEIEEDASTIQ